MMVLDLAQFFSLQVVKAKTKRLVGRMTAQPHNHFVFCVWS